MKRVLIFTFIIMLLFGCSAEQVTKPSDIRQDFYNDSMELFTILDTDYRDATPVSKGDSKKVEIFLEKYSDEKANNFNETETELLHDICNMITVVLSNDIGERMNDNDLKDGTLKGYVESSDKVKNILGMK